MNSKSAVSLECSSSMYVSYVHAQYDPSDLAKFWVTKASIITVIYIMSKLKNVYLLQCVPLTQVSWHSLVLKDARCPGDNTCFFWAVSSLGACFYWEVLFRGHFWWMQTFCSCLTSLLDRFYHLHHVVMWKC